MSRPRLLFLGPILPYPPDRGMALRSYHLLRYLARRYAVDLLLFRRRDDPTQMPLEDRIAHLEAFGTVEVFEIPGERSGGRRRWDQVRSLLMRRSEARWRYESQRYRRRVLERVFERDPRLVHVDGMTLHGYLPLLTGRRVVLAHPRPLAAHLRQRADLAAGLEAAYLDRQSAWMGQAEREWLPRVTANVVSSDPDRELLSERAPAARIEVISAAVDTDHFSPVPSSGHGLAFVGGATAPASRDALDYFAREILPRLRRHSGVQALEPISWVGRARSGDRERYREVGIDITGYVEDIRPIVRPAACYVVPRRVAGGSSRILQAWALGKAVVSTSVGCEGLDARDGENVLIRDDPTAFARAVLDVLEDSGLRHRLGQGARETVEDSYSWKRNGERLVDLYERLESAAPMAAAGDRQPRAAAPAPITGTG